MRANITTTTGLKINIYQILSIAEEDDEFIVHGDVCNKEPMIIGFDNLPGTPMSTYVLTLCKPMIATIKIH